MLEGTLDDIRARTSSGERLEVDVDEALSLDVFTDMEGVERAAWLAPGRAVLGLRPGVELGRVLHQITGGVHVNGVRTERERLHEIFLRAVGRDLDEREFADASPTEEN